MIASTSVAAARAHQRARARACGEPADERRGDRTRDSSNTGSKPEPRAARRGRPRTPRDRTGWPARRARRGCPGARPELDEAGLRARRHRHAAISSATARCSAQPTTSSARRGRAAWREEACLDAPLPRERVVDPRAARGAPDSAARITASSAATCSSIVRVAEQHGVAAGVNRRHRRVRQRRGRADGLHAQVVAEHHAVEAQRRLQQIRDDARRDSEAG